jgi:hypothetical protein
MNKCKCGRELRFGETDCPACTSKKSHRWKKVAEGVGSIALVVGGIILYALTGRKSGKSA